MGVHSFHIFDRKGKTLFTKRYAKDPDGSGITDEEHLAEQRKLVFGMLFSLREVVASLSPQSNDAESLHSVQTGASTLHNYETSSGLRFALYMSNSYLPTSSSSSSYDGSKSIRSALQYIYTELWLQCVVRSPLYRPTDGNISSTNFEQKLDAYLNSQPWFR